ncbi:TIGR02466 family protein [uncultured Sphingomonas sp.]|uniref:TIGR02466 family protein n=1 Tax=uncultured Sphingomonas sp. TaxID=158754 RepID=UPI0025E2F42A|nr:TIGR02466 family protein [uncultured Sphingomonas sp.]
MPIAPADLIPAPADVVPLFVTEVYRTNFGGTALDPLIDRLDAGARRLAAADTAGQAWSDRNGYLGYTSYDSFDVVTDAGPEFADLTALLDVHVMIYAQLLEMDLRGEAPRMTRSWVNVLHPGGAHGGHVHPHSIVSGTLYLSVPDGASALQFEDPRHTRMMHAPMRRPSARADRQPVMAMAPARGTLMLWESWLRHEVPTNRAGEERISISFNYDL